MHISHKSQCLRSSIYNFILNRIAGKITAFSKHKSEFPSKEQLTLLLSTIPKSSSFSDQAIQSSHADFQQSHSGSLTSSLFVSFFPLRSPQNCNSVLASMVVPRENCYQCISTTGLGRFSSAVALMLKVLLLSVPTSSWQFIILLLSKLLNLH